MNIKAVPRYANWLPLATIALTREVSCSIWLRWILTSRSNRINCDKSQVNWQGCWSLTIALRMTSSLRMQEARVIFYGLSLDGSVLRPASGSSAASRRIADQFASQVHWASAIPLVARLSQTSLTHTHLLHLFCILPYPMRILSHLGWVYQCHMQALCQYGSHRWLLKSRCRFPCPATRRSFWQSLLCYS